MPRIDLAVARAWAGLRVDHFLQGFPELPSRSQFGVRGLTVLCFGLPLKMSKRLKGGEILSVAWEEEKLPELMPLAMDLEILYEDGDTLVLNKPRGVAIHPGAGTRGATLVQGILAYLSEPPEMWQAPGRPGIVHRLDKETTGVLLCARNTAALAFYSGQFRERTVRKTYLALVRGRPPEVSGRLDTLLGRDPRHRQRFAVVRAGGKRAVTLYKTLASVGSQTLLELGLLTGRTHQLRVHLAHLDCPILGDSLYSRKAEGPLLLHSWVLEARTVAGVRLEWRAELPADFRSRLRAGGFSSWD